LFASRDESLEIDPHDTRLDVRRVEKVAKKIASATSHPWTIMEVCAGQTRMLLEYDLRRYLPEQLRLVHGPGCAICATPLATIDRAIAICQLDSVVFCCSGELLRLKGSDCDLLEMKARGADIRVVHSPLDSLTLARKMPEKKVVFFTIGFETKVELNALSVWQAKRLGLKNFYLLYSHPCVSAVCSRVLRTVDTPVKGILSPGDVCSVTGTSEYERLSQKYGAPFVITGYQPLDLLEGILSCVKFLESGKSGVKAQYERAISRDGNQQAKALISEVFEVKDREWRGIGNVERGGYRMKSDFAAYDAFGQFEVDVVSRADSPSCISNQILLGLKVPTDCPVFGNSCHPNSPQGATMVSNQGTCFTYYNFRHNHSA